MRLLPRNSFCSKYLKAGALAGLFHCFPLARIPDYFVFRGRAELDFFLTAFLAAVFAFFGFPDSAARPAVTAAFAPSTMRRAFA
jgi:hypothetical protein